MQTHARQFSPSLLQLCDVFKHIFMLFHELEAGSNYFRIDTPLGTGLAGVLLAHGVIFTLEDVPNLRWSNTPPPISHPGLGVYCSLVSLFCFGGKPFWKWANSLSLHPAEGGFSQKSRRVIYLRLYSCSVRGCSVIPQYGSLQHWELSRPLATWVLLGLFLF